MPNSAGFAPNPANRPPAGARVEGVDGAGVLPTGESIRAHRRGHADGTHVPVEGAAEAGFAKLNKPPAAAAAGAGAGAAVVDSTGFAGAPKEKLGGAALGVELASVVCSAGFPKRLGVDGAVVLENWSEDTRGERRHGTYAVGPAAAPKRLIAGLALRYQSASPHKRNQDPLYSRSRSVTEQATRRRLVRRSYIPSRCSGLAEQPTHRWSRSSCRTRRGRGLSKQSRGSRCSSRCSWLTE